MDCGLGFTPTELFIIRAAIQAGVVSVTVFSLAYMTKTLSKWLHWTR